MDLTKIDAKIRANEDSPMPIEVQCLVDPDAPVSIVPSKVLDDLDLRATGEEAVELGGGEKGSRKVGQAYFEVLGCGAWAKVAWGLDGDKPRLGYGTVEACGLMIDPRTQVVREPRPTGE